ncbi:oxidoreductase, short chain dehydrogenase/reductase family [Aspergillus novofumigatus IBT 16806]|uniref:Oxidoreductase n=1 Tax=Aspergillus novofumigatus (strain IBT 16806) TaxID=1392255 RepID=A0A2I1CCL7_ASPN1|nr:oxidoreductase [Aspergillus novofumigatus IBT 16806]PKX95355.1 oxidoreductase [Aspergillus novofumigatus IBT 16806]
MDTARGNRSSYHSHASTGHIPRDQHAGAASSFEIQSERKRITGGAGMLALASARALLEHGLSGIALLDLPSALQKGDVEIEALRRDFPSAKIITHQCDVTDAADMQHVAEKAKNELGELNILCCFAGIVNCVAAEDITVEQWRRVIDVNTTGSWIAAQATYDCQWTRGKIVLVASISGHRVNYPQPQIAYNVSKAAVLHMKNSLAAEWTQYGIRVNSISPGYMDTVLNEGEDLAPWRQIWADRNPMRRMGSPQELTGPVVFLCSDIGGAISMELILLLTEVVWCSRHIL